MTQSINTTKYWEGRYSSGDWLAVGGPQQTRDFAESQVKRLGLSHTFAGKLLDFGCGTGDAFPVYKKSFPAATLMGVDFSESAIDHCRERFGEFATFMVRDHRDVPYSDVIIASNVIEHIEADKEVVYTLLRRCHHLYVIVPYMEWPRISEHVHTYDKNYFDDFYPSKVQIYPCKGWSQYGWRPHWLNIRLKNLIRPWVGRDKVQRRLQVMYSFHR